MLMRKRGLFFGYSDDKVVELNPKQSDIQTLQKVRKVSRFLRNII